MSDAVDAFLAKLDHPLKPTIEFVRETILAAHPSVTEQIKWNAPSFSANGEYLATFHLRPLDRVHLVVHSPSASSVECRLFRDPKPDGRRMVYFSSLEEAKASAVDLTDMVRKLIGKTNAQG